MEAALEAAFIVFGLWCSLSPRAVPDHGIRPARAMVNEAMRAGNSFPQPALACFVTTRMNEEAWKAPVSCHPGRHHDVDAHIRFTMK